MKEILQLFILMVIHSLTIVASEDSGWESADALQIVPVQAALALPQPPIINQQPQLLPPPVQVIQEEKEITCKEIFWDNPECCCALSCCCKALSCFILMQDESNREALLEEISHNSILSYINSALNQADREERYFKRIELYQNISVISGAAIFYFTRKIIKKYSKKDD